ncbi:MAG: hypothetical protein SGJ02_10775, partial [bacterium]|nr:hypothetical protein [bacterium]
LILEAFFTHVHSGVEKHLEKVVANVDYLLTTKKFSPLNLSTTDAIRIASKTTKSLKGKADKILSTFNEILSDPDFADLHETPKLVVASICNHPKDPKKFLTDALLKEQTILGQEEFSHLVNNKWLVRLAAFSHPNTTEDFLGKVWRVYNVLKDDPELKLFQKRNKILLEAAANLSSTDEKAMKIEAKEILLASQKRYLELLRNPACADLLKNKSFLLRLAFSNREDPLGAVNTILSNIQSIKDDAAYKHFHHLPKIIELACFRSMRDPHSYLDALTQRLNKVYGNKETQKGALRFAQIKPYFPKKSSLAA